MPSRILVVNSGSSSLKFKLFDWVAQSTLTPCVSGLLERVGDAANSSVTVKVRSTRYSVRPSHCYLAYRIVQQRTENDMRMKVSNVAYRA